MEQLTRLLLLSAAPACLLAAATLRVEATSLGAAEAVRVKAASTAAAEPSRVRSSAPKAYSWIGPDGIPLPFRTRDQVEEFLRSARITSAKELSVGITRPIRVMLEADGIRMKAVFRYVDMLKREWKSPDGVRVNYRDSFKFELAAYRLNCLLGMDQIPPTVARKLKREDFADRSLINRFPRRTGTLQAWVEDAMTEKNRDELGSVPPSGIYWIYQFQVMTLFDNLLFNDDRNQGNILIGPDWKIWFIDSTRAFRTFRTLPTPKNLKMCDKVVWERLQALTDAEIREELDDLLTDSELKTLLIRRDRIVEHITAMIDQKGRQRVLFDLLAAEPAAR